MEEGFDDIMRPEFGKDYQELKIQEQIHRLPVGHFPSSIWVVCFDDLVDTCKAGDDVTVTGKLLHMMPLLLLTFEVRNNATSFELHDN